MLLHAFAAAALMLAPASGGAQEREFAIDEIASDLAYGFCPLFLAGRFSLTAPELAERGFGTKIAKQPNARFGEMETVLAERPDGDVVFGGVSGKVCSVVIGRANRDALLAKLRGSMSFMGLDFKAAPEGVAKVPGIEVETFKAPVEGQMLYVQLISAGGPTPIVAVQLLAGEE
jgi:hypothetical protein